MKLTHALFKEFKLWESRTIPSKGRSRHDLASPQFPDDHSSLYLSLVVPTYQESHHVAQIVERVTQVLDPILGDRYELILVDDDSPDRTWEIALNLTAQYPQLRVLRRRSERGLSTAVIAGWQMARGELLGAIDADLQHPPETLVQLFQEIQQGADLAIASRHVVGGGVSDWSVLRRCLSRGAQLLGLVILPEVVGRVSDPMSGYFMVRRSCIAERPLYPLGYKILIEVLGRGDIRWISEVGYVFQERQSGESKVTSQQYLEYLGHLVRLRLACIPTLRLFRFYIVGLTGILVDFSLFYILRDRLDLALTRSAILSAELAIVNNFIWNDVWTFGDISQQQTSMRKRLKRFLKFNLICLLGLGLNVLILNILFNALGVDEYIAKLTAIVLVSCWNLWINLKLSWRVTDV